MGVSYRGNDQYRPAVILSEHCRGNPSRNSLAPVFIPPHEAANGKSSHPTATRTATKLFWPLAEEGPISRKLFVLLVPGGANPTRLPSADFESAFDRFARRRMA